MTIKEAELRTGLARANIRYYEDQGFFTADRGENGYRNYSEENVDTLLKVKLLRQLGFSLEDIHDLQKGDQTLGPALERREAGLEQESRALNQAASLCRIMREEGADFYTLDARRYLDVLAQEETVIAQDRDPARIFPWRRLFARDLDLLLYTTLLTVLFQLTARLNIVRVSQSAGGMILLRLGALALMAGAETLMIALTGTTPGKALLGLKILREDGSRLSLAEAGRRTMIAVLYFGLAQCLIGSRLLLLQLAGIVMLIWACWQVYHERPLFWEENQLYLDGSTKERVFWENNRNWFRIVGYLAAVAACIGLVLGGHYLASLPPHRGQSLTVEQFVENYNQYMAFAYGEENVSRHLTEDGTFVEIERPGTTVIHIFGDDTVPNAVFQFAQKDDRLVGFILTRTYEGGGVLAEDDVYGVSIPYDEIYVAMRSLLWSRLGEKKVISAYNDLVAAKGNYLGALDGVQINSEMRFSGYNPWGDSTLFAQKGQKQNYFVEFTMELT